MENARGGRDGLRVEMAHTKSRYIKSDERVSMYIRGLKLDERVVAMIEYIQYIVIRRNMLYSNGRSYLSR